MDNNMLPSIEAVAEKMYETIREEANLPSELALPPYSETTDATKEICRHQVTQVYKAIAALS